MARESVKIVNGALDEVEGGNIILRGVIDTESLRLLKAADYQREILPIAKITELVEAFKTGSVPDVDLGMRGGDYKEREGAFYLQDDVYIVDGLQRVTAGIHMMKTAQGTPRLGCAIYFNTTEEWERARFKILNVDRTKLSPNVLLRNLRKTTPSIELLYGLTTGSGIQFPLADRVCWAQRMQRRDIITALTLCKTVGALHAHIGPGRSHRLGEVARGLQLIYDRVGRQNFLANVITLVEMVDECWGIRSIAFKEGAVYMRSNFLVCLALFFSKHETFWKGHRLIVERDIVRKIAGFPVTDPHVSQLAASGGQARGLLYNLLLEHVNSGKRTRRLMPREMPRHGNKDKAANVGSADGANNAESEVIA